MKNVLFYTLTVAATLVLPSTASSKTLVYCSEASPETFTPMLSTSDSTFDASAKTIFNRLVEFKPGSTEIGPALAERWDLSPDGKEYTFHLRRSVKFHGSADFTPTREFNADDVLYTFNRQRDTNNPFHKLGNATYEMFSALGLGAMINSIDKIDDFTVRFKLKEPNVTFLAGIALDYMSIMSLEQAEKMVAAGTPELIERQPVGTGPFQLQAYVQDSQVRYTANNDYWGGAPKIDTLVFAITPEPMVRVERLKANECQVAALPPPSAVESLKQNPDITVFQSEGQNIGMLGFNTERKPFDDVKVRTALSKAINRQAVVESVYQGSGVIAGSTVPPAQLGAVKDAVVDYDPDGARTLLAEAGQSEGLSVKLWAMPVSRPYNPNARRMAELIQADWAAVGVKSETVVFEWAEYLQRTSAGEHDVFLLGGSSDNGDTDNLLSYMFSCDGVAGGSNRSRWCDQNFEELLAKGRVTSDLAQRAEIYRQAQAVLKEQIPALPIAHSIVSTPVRKTVLNYTMDPFGRQNFAGVDIAE